MSTSFIQTKGVTAMIVKIIIVIRKLKIFFLIKK
nr:MAG TPA: hypothetical protein [Caudoviricetes sp.]DAY65784.1 MAG TPA: hypothetical protein [Caudoviricetes sp.]